MNASRKALLIGLPIALLVAGGGSLYALHLKGELSALVEKCKAQTQGIPPGYEPVCNPESLGQTADGPLSEIARTNRQLHTVEAFTVSSAIGIAVLAVIPWAWYFILRRVQELAEAIRRK
jgi:hypothetical protein